MNNITESDIIKNQFDSYFNFKVLGDNGPFSSVGSSITYMFETDNKDIFLIDCGAPIFTVLNKNQIAKIKGIFITHTHDDHKRWLTDFLLYRKYVLSNFPKPKIISSYKVINDIIKSCMPALKKSLDLSSKNIIEYRFEDFAEIVRIGPVPKYEIKKIINNNKEEYRIVDENNKFVSDKKGKVVINPKTKSKYILFFDELDKVWVNPEIYYDFSEHIFYTENINYKIDSNLKVTAVNSTAWHGTDSISLEINYENTKIFFSGDTVFNMDLWKSFSQSEHKQITENYLNKFIIEKDISDLIEKKWSDIRLNTALEMYENSDLIFQDIAKINSIVHTDYIQCSKINKNKVVFIHTPDDFVSECPLIFYKKEYVIKNKKIYEKISGDGIRSFNADFYYKKQNKLFYAFENVDGNYTIKKDDKGFYNIEKYNNSYSEYKNYFLYENINGKLYKIDNEFKSGYIEFENKVYKIEYENKNKIILLLEN